MSEPFYRETQGISPGVMALVIGPMVGLFIVVTTTLLRSSGPTEQEWSGAAWLSVVCAVVCASMVFVRLETEVRKEGLFLRFVPFRRFQVKLDGLVSHRAVTYRPIREYGGWGWRKALTQKRTAYNMRGNRGVQLDFAGGTHILIGSQEPEKLDRALTRLLKGGA